MMRRRDLIGLLAAAALPWTRPALASQALLDEFVGFAGQFLFLSPRTPALVLGVVRGGRRRSSASAAVPTIRTRRPAPIRCSESVRSPSGSPARFWRAWPRTAWSASPIL